MNINSAACWRTLSCQGPARNGIETCLNLVIVQEAIQSRFRRGVVTPVDSTFLSTLLHSKLVVETVKVLTHLKGSITPKSPLNPIKSLEWDPRLDINCCGHSVENLSTTPDLNPPPLIIGRTYRQLLLVVVVRVPLPINGLEQLVNLFLFHHWNELPSPIVAILMGKGSMFSSGEPTSLSSNFGARVFDPKAFSTRFDRSRLSRITSRRRTSEDFCSTPPPRA